MQAEKKFPPFEAFTTSKVSDISVFGVLDIDICFLLEAGSVRQILTRANKDSARCLIVPSLYKHGGRSMPGVNSVPVSKSF